MSLQVGTAVRVKKTGSTGIVEEVTHNREGSTALVQLLDGPLLPKRFQLDELQNECEAQAQEPGVPPPPIDLSRQHSEPLLERLENAQTKSPTHHSEPVLVRIEPDDSSLSVDATPFVPDALDSPLLTPKPNPPPSKTKFSSYDSPLVRCPGTKRVYAPQPGGTWNMNGMLSVADGIVRSPEPGLVFLPPPMLPHHGMYDAHNQVAYDRAIPKRTRKRRTRKPRKYPPGPKPVFECTQCSTKCNGEQQLTQHIGSSGCKLRQLDLERVDCRPEQSIFIGNIPLACSTKDVLACLEARGIQVLTSGSTVIKMRSDARCQYAVVQLTSPDQRMKAVTFHHDPSADKVTIPVSVPVTDAQGVTVPTTTIVELDIKPYRQRAKSENL